MPRCAAGNHFAAKEGDKNCSACVDSVKKMKRPHWWRKLPHQVGALTETFEKSNDTAATDVEDAFQTLTTKTNTATTLIPESKENLTLEEALTWTNINEDPDEEGPFSCKDHDNYFWNLNRNENKIKAMRGRVEELKEVFSHMQLSTRNDYEELVNALQPLACDCHYYPTGAVLESMVEKGKVNISFVPKALQSLTQEEKKENEEKRSYKWETPSAEVTLYANTITSAVLNNGENITPQFLKEAYEIVKPQEYNGSDGLSLYSPDDGKSLSAILAHPETPESVLEDFSQNFKTWFRHRTTMQGYQDNKNNVFHYGKDAAIALAYHPKGEKYVKKIQRYLTRRKIALGLKRVWRQTREVGINLITLGSWLAFLSDKPYHRWRLQPKVQYRDVAATKKSLKAKKNIPPKYTEPF